MRTQQIVLGLIEQGGGYVLQRRNGAEQVGALGLVGCFGGKIEPGETAEAAVIREIAEETSLVTTASDWEKVGEVAVNVEINNELVNFPTTVFRMHAAAEVVIEAKEGELVRANPSQPDFDRATLTPATAAVFNELL